MNKTLLSAAISAALLFLVSGTTNAKSWRISPNVNDGDENVFAGINSALSSGKVNDGDTLYLDPGLTIETATISKSVTVIGCGYFRSSTPHKFAVITSTINIQAKGVKLEGIACDGEIKFGGNDKSGDNTIIERCKIGKLTWSAAATARNVTIRQCYITGEVYARENYSNGLTVENCIVASGQAFNILGANSTIINNYLSPYYYTGCAVVVSDASSNVKNNIIVNRATNEGRAFDYGGEAIFTHNVSSSRTSREGNKSIDVNNTDALEAVVFALTGLNDERFTLKNDSPAKGYAEGGGDCGPFGGQYPYVPGGMPKYAPYFTKANIASKATGNELSVSLQIVQQEQ